MGGKLYMDCEAGISGDMFVASLIDLGADLKKLETILAKLPIGGFQIEVTRVQKSGLDACDFNVILDKSHENHDHDMEYLHGHKVVEEHHHEHHHDENHEQHHQHGHDENHEHHHHEHRGIKEINEIIDGSEMTENAKNLSKRIFSIIAKAEAKAHGVPEEDVHFHEVGAIDSIVDVLAAAICIDDLGITEVYVKRLCEGNGTVRCQHGMLSIPVPAVANIVADNHIPLHITEVEGELVTPTGAAIIAAIRTNDKLPENFLIKKIGIGAGKRDYATSGIVRAFAIQYGK